MTSDAAPARSSFGGGAGVVAAGAAWLVFALNFNVLAITDGDSTVQFAFVRRLFGADVDAVGYHFGLGLLEAPAYAVGLGLDALGWESAGGRPITEVAVAFGTILVVLLALVVAADLLRRLELPGRGFAVLAALFGTPLFFYGTFIPGKTHAYDALLFTVALALVFVLLRDGGDRVAVALGAVLGLAIVTRYLSGAELVAVAGGLLLLRRARHAAVVAATACVAVGALLLVPLVLGVSLTGRGYDTGFLSFTPLGPLKMLFTEHRGLFVWSPIALLGLAGYALLFARRPEHRPFLGIGAAMAVLLLASYASVDFWDGTWSFSQRFLTPVFPLVAIGIAALWEWRPRLTAVASSIAVLWTVFLALTLQVVGPPEGDYGNLRGGALDLANQVRVDDVSPAEFAWGVYNESRLLP